MAWLFREVDHSQLYHKYRPLYPDKVFELIAEKLKQSYDQLPEKEKIYGDAIGKEEKWKIALDVGCGTGQTTLPLIKYFKETFGIDVSETQIHEAKLDYGNKDPSKVTFLCYDSNTLSQLFQESTIDLVTVALAIHYFDRVNFYIECKKVLRPGGLLVAYGYGFPYFDDSRLNSLFEEFFEAIKMCADDGSLLVLDHYSKIFSEFQSNFACAERNDSFKLVVDSNVQDHMGYFSTWSPYRKYIKRYPDREDPLKVFHDKFNEMYPDPAVTIKRYANIFMLFARRD